MLYPLSYEGAKAHATRPAVDQPCPPVPTRSMEHTGTPVITHGRIYRPSVPMLTTAAHRRPRVCEHLRSRHDGDGAGIGPHVGRRQDRRTAAAVSPCATSQPPTAGNASLGGFQSLRRPRDHGHKDLLISAVDQFLEHGVRRI
jgi:hypothetical protein